MVERRKTVTVVFCDVVGSTPLGESTDPEVLRALLARYFDRMRSIVEAHGGTVEKFIGDAVMAVFGVPVAHEDDALRACRAAVEMRDALPEVGVEGRLGVMAGEVVTGTEERLATGDAVNVAARLQQAAQPGEVLIGELVSLLAGGAVEVAPVGSLELKGKAEPVRAFRLIEAHAPDERRREQHFVGRKRELAAIEEAWKRVRFDRRCELLTIVGEPGVGKSHLVAEALGHMDGRVVQGRCLPYGDGITYWPVVEVIKQLKTRPAEPQAQAVIGSLLGETDAATTAEEIAWAFRKLLEHAAPLIVVFDDIQWGEETFLDLVEHVALLATESPVLLLCMARPELAEQRSDWPIALQLVPLAEEEVRRLIGRRLPAEVRDRIARASGGNPLFVSEMLAMARQGDRELVVPATLQALLEERLDRLSPGERRALECGAVEGEVFHRGTVQALAPEESQVTPRLAALVRKQLIRPDRAQLPGEDGFRFRHLLIRDAAYESLPKARRAELHERFADWLEQRDGDLVELDELVGHHFEKACRYCAELGRRDEAPTSAAAQHLGAAGRRALRRGNAPAAASLLSRATALADDDVVRLSLLHDLAAALDEAGELGRAYAVLSEVAGLAQVLGDRRVELRAIVAQCDLEVSIAPDRLTPEEFRRTIEGAIAEFETLHDDEGLSSALPILATAPLDSAAKRRLLERARECAQRTADERQQAEIMIQIGIVLIFGPTPAVVAIDHVEESLAWYRAHGIRRAEAQALAGLAHLRAMRGEFDLARVLFAEHEAIAVELGQRYVSAAFAWASGAVERLAGDFAAVERVLRPAWEKRKEMGDKRRSGLGAALAEAALMQGHIEEAERWAQRSAEAAQLDPWAPHSAIRMIQARILARGGQVEQAEALAREAVALYPHRDWIVNLSPLLAGLAEVLRLAGQTEEAASVAREALKLDEQKGNLASARTTGALLDELLQANASIPR